MCRVPTRSAKRHDVQARCPICSGNIDALSLGDIQRHISRCGKKAKTAVPVRRSLLPDATSIPSLPFVIEVPLAIPSQNSSHKKHWAIYSKELARWRNTLEPLLRPLLGLNLVWSRWSFLRLIPARGRWYDDANLVGGGKPIPDALKEFGVIKDDAVKYFKADYDQLVLREHPEADRLKNAGVLSIITLLEAR